MGYYDYVDYDQYNRIRESNDKANNAMADARLASYGSKRASNEISLLTERFNKACLVNQALLEVLQEKLLLLWNDPEP